MFKLATAVLGLAIIIYIVGDMFSDKISFNYQLFSRNLIFLSIALYILAIIIKIFSRILKPFSKTKCIKCGTPIPKGHLYCRKHEQELADKTRKNLENTWSKKHRD